MSIKNPPNPDGSKQKELPPIKKVTRKPIPKKQK